MPLSKLTSHIDEFDRDISLRDEEYEIREYIPERTKEYRDKSWRLPCICLTPHTSPKSPGTSDDDACIFWESSDDLICHFLPDNMFEWLDIDVSRRIDEDILLIGDGFLDTIECSIYIFDTSSFREVPDWNSLKSPHYRTDTGSMEIGLGHHG